MPRSDGIKIQFNRPCLPKIKITSHLRYIPHPGLPIKARCDSAARFSVGVSTGDLPSLGGMQRAPSHTSSLHRPSRTSQSWVGPGRIIRSLCPSSLPRVRIVVFLVSRCHLRLSHVLLLRIYSTSNFASRHQRPSYDGRARGCSPRPPRMLHLCCICTSPVSSS